MSATLMSWKPATMSEQGSPARPSWTHWFRSQPTASPRPSRASYVVNELTDHDVHNVYEVRQALEVLAATQACGLHTPRQLVRLKSLIDEYETVDHSDAEEIFRLGIAFHSALVEPCPNCYLLKLLAGVWSHPVNRRISRTLDYTPEQQATVASDHRLILDALGRNDAGAMVEILGGCFHISSRE